MAVVVGYGVDTSCTDSLQLRRYIGGWERVAEAAYRRLNTERGTMPRLFAEDANYGIDLPGLIGATEIDDIPIVIPGRIRNELLKSRYIALVEPKLTITNTNPVTVASTIALRLHGESQTFAFALTADAVKARFLGLVQS